MLLLASGLDLNEKMSSEDKALLDGYCNKLAANEPDFDETFTNLDMLVEGKKWIVQTYSGDTASYKAEYDFIEFILPGENFNCWSEGICLINNPPNEENAYKLINFLTTEKAAASFSNEFYFANGIVGSGVFLSKDIKDDYFINMPSKERAKGVYYYKTKEKMNNMQKTFSQLLEASSQTE
jgi:spermidine/putrescine-binding protein